MAMPEMEAAMNAVKLRKAAEQALVDAGWTPEQVAKYTKAVDRAVIRWMYAEGDLDVKVEPQSTPFMDGLAKGS
jgi:hypothetical protein